MRAAIHRFADDVPGWIAIPFRAVFFTVFLLGMATWLAGCLVVAAAGWWWDQVKG